MKQINVAVIGAGLMAEAHIKAFSDIPSVAVVGIHSRTKERARALATKYNIPNTYNSVDSLYVGTQANFVIVAVSELSVNSVCMEVFKYPWQSLIEKPVGYNLPDALLIAAAAKSADRKAYVALNRRHYSSTRAVLGELESFKGARLVHAFDQEDPITALEGGKPALVVDNWMYANSIHIIDYLNVFCRGEVIAVNHAIKWNSDEPRFVVASVTYSSGDIGFYHATWNGPGPWSISVTTQAKRWEMRPLEQATSQHYKSRKTEPLFLNSWDSEYKPGLRQQAEEAIKALRGEAHYLPTLADGIKTMRLVHSIYEA
jgi:predicted dehydrogenase